nr:DNA translocase FtsK [Bacteroidales bacterium]
MPKQANKFKEETNKPVKKKKQKRSSRKNKNNSFGFLSNEKFRKISGSFLILLSIYLLFAFISYFFSWWLDYDKISKIDLSDFNGRLDINNWAGFIGAYLSDIFIYRSFGISSFLFTLILFISGIKLATGFSLLHLGKTFRYSLFFIIWLSVSFGFLLQITKFPILGGAFGLQTALWMDSIVGTFGTGILLFFLLISFLIIVFNIPFTFSIFKSKSKNPEPDTNNRSINNIPPEDKYNTLEFAITEDEGVNAEKNEENRTDTANTPELETTNNDVEIEFTVEETKLNNGDSNSETEHQTIDTQFDPTLDLPHYIFPTLNLLNSYDSGLIKVQQDELEENKNKIVETLNNYSIKIERIKATIGPAVTLYEIIPAPGIRISKIKNLEDDIAMSLAAMGIRIIAPIPGKGTIGIEVPNKNPEVVSVKSILSSKRFRETSMELPLGLGKTIANESFVIDLAKMPHILMAGATGQGKSVGLNTIITSLLYKKHPSQIKFVMVDPKKVELTLFSKIERHFLAKLPNSEEAIITDTRKVVCTLNSLNIEMDNRYELLKNAQVRNIKEYNKKFVERKLNPINGHRYLPYIILVVDEFADLIMTAGKEIENPLTRLAQLARAIGIHLVIATQRPSVNIITGTIKANFPARIAFRVISKIDSRTILDTGGADQLIGRGDMLLATGNDVIRLQCAFIDTDEIENVTSFIGEQRAYPEAFALPEYEDEENGTSSEYDPNERDELFEDAARIIVLNQQGSTSLLQRKLKLGYNRAGRIIDQLEAAGIVGQFEGSKAREVRVANEFALEQFLKDLDFKE